MKGRSSGDAGDDDSDCDDNDVRAIILTRLIFPFHYHFQSFQLFLFSISPFLHLLPIWLLSFSLLSFPSLYCSSTWLLMPLPTSLSLLHHILFDVTSPAPSSSPPPSHRDHSSSRFYLICLPEHRISPTAPSLTSRH